MEKKGKIEYEEEEKEQLKDVEMLPQENIQEVEIQHSDTEGYILAEDIEKVLVKETEEDDCIEHEKAKGFVGGDKSAMNKKDREENQMLERDFLKENDININKDINRPSLTRSYDETEKQPLVFMQIDIDYYVTRKEDCVLRMYGVTKEGNSVLTHIHGFRPYFYVEISPIMKINKDDIYDLKKLFESKMPEDGGISQIELCSKQNIYHYQPEMQKFLKISFRSPKYMNQLKAIIESGISFKGEQFKRVTFESQISFVLRFMVNTDIVGMGWILIKTDKYAIRSSKEKISSCQLEIDVHSYHDLRSLQSDRENSKIAPLRILSFDIECAAEGHRFPTAEKDAVIQIANICMTSDKKEPFIRNIFTLKSCAPIVGTEVFSFENEKDLLIAWREFMVQVDPDILTGYNITCFDIPYLMERAETLGIHKYSRFSKLKDSLSKVKDNTFHSKMMGSYDYKDINIEGRIQFDLLQIIRREHKLRSYSLNNVSAHFLKEQKEDVHYSVIGQLQEKDQFSRRRLAIYCLKDAYLPLRLMDKLILLFNFTEMARVTGVPISYLFNRGQQIKVASMLYRKAHMHNYVIPCEKNQGNEGRYEGAVVIDPRTGYYTDPVVTLDFVSLYPSIMMAHNLCYSTLVPNYRAKLLKREDYEVTPNDDIFVKSSVKKGLLPMILDELLTARKSVKEEYEEEKDEFMKNVLYCRQLALKVSANSVYGFTGSQLGILPCLPIGRSVTGYGRKMIEETRSLITNTFKKDKGYEFNCEVIYGDTDSVMVRFGVSSIEEAMELGKEAAVEISKHFPNPIKLDFEKVYCPYLLMSKKRYAGLLYTSPDKYDKIDAKGIETVRRDNCSLVKELVNQCLKIILIQKDYEKAIEHCKGVISDLLQNRIDLSMLIITKTLNKSFNTSGNYNQSYTARTAHAELAQKMMKREETQAPVIGERIAFVMTKKSKKSKAYEKAEDPLVVLEKGIAIDYDEYLEKQLKKPLLRVFTPILGSNTTGELFGGDHTKIRYVAPIQKEGLGNFVQIKKKCLSCKKVMNTEDALCKECSPKMKEIYIERMLEMMRYQKNYSDLWVQCQRCQGSLHQEILCQSRDCPIFYRRVKVEKNIRDEQAVLNRFPQW
ncbi:unnamed protein product [Moneuplotes crassus]|uniref:DNA polymerase n=1 Tax=Euplotes crassus TaxID=5936 RepID=A0AAD1XN10_EUPCR|nr:unnamed protein product [Moneuplotes crassus]